MRRVFKHVIPIFIRHSPLMFCGIVVSFLLGGLAESWAIKYMGAFFNTIGTFSQNKSTLFEVILALSIFFGIKIGIQLLSGAGNFLGEMYDQKLIGALRFQFHGRMGKIPLESFEDSDQLNWLIRAEKGIPKVVGMLNTLMDLLIYYLPYFLSVGVYLYRLDPLLSLALVAVFVPTLIHFRLQSSSFKALDEETAAVRRRVDHYKFCLVDKSALKETRLLGAENYFKNKLKYSLRDFSSKVKTTELKSMKRELLCRIASLFGYVFVLMLLLKAFREGKIEMGEFAAIFASIEGMLLMMEELLIRRMGSFFKQYGSIQAYLEFCEASFVEGDQSLNALHSQEEGRGIALNYVSFVYPNAQGPSLKNINLTIEPGETIAIVGANGSGKSTLLKVLSGLYQPTEGQVYHNNQCVKTIKPKTLHDKSSGVLQSFLRYELELLEGVKLFNKGMIHLGQASEKVVKEALLSVNLNADDAAEFPDGLKTPLSRTYGGKDLSGGQWQRVAIARAMVKQSDLLLLDEPTSAIDPVEEIRLYELFKGMAKEKTTLIITHRLGAVRFSDRVIVMANGEINAIGKHEELLGSSELYQEMWQAQLAI